MTLPRFLLRIRLHRETSPWIVRRQSIRKVDGGRSREVGHSYCRGVIRSTHASHNRPPRSQYREPHTLCTCNHVFLSPPEFHHIRESCVYTYVIVSSTECDGAMLLTMMMIHKTGTLTLKTHPRIRSSPLQPTRLKANVSSQAPKSSTVLANSSCTASLLVNLDRSNGRIVGPALALLRSQNALPLPPLAAPD